MGRKQLLRGSTPIWSEMSIRNVSRLSGESGHSSRYATTDTSLQATAQAFYRQVTKVKPTEDPHPPSGTTKEKILHTEALARVMNDVDLGGSLGDGLGKYGQTRTKLAIAQEAFGQRLGEGSMAGLDSAKAVVDEYKAMRKKLDSRRLTLDASLYRLKTAKKDHFTLEHEVNMAQERFDEVQEETIARLETVAGCEEQLFADFTEFVDAELEYFTKCKEIMEDLKSSWPTQMSSGSRPRARSNASHRTQKTARTAREIAFSDDEEPTNRSRSQSNASNREAKSEKRRSIFSFGKKSAAKKPSRDKGGDGYGNLDEDELDYNSDDEPQPVSFTANGRTRSQTLSTERREPRAERPSPMRRTYTSPMLGSGSTQHVKAIFDFDATAADELSLRVGDIIQVREAISSEWWIGECDGMSGLFPRAYTEDHHTSITVPTRRRSLAPTNGHSTAKAPPRPAMDGPLTSDSEASIDTEHHLSSPLSYVPEKPRNPPPAPPSRRTQSASNVLDRLNDLDLSETSDDEIINPKAYRDRSGTLTKMTSIRSPFGGASPFAGSEDEGDGWHTPLAINAR